MSVSEYNNRLKAVLHRKNDEKELLAHSAIFNRQAQLTEKPDKDGNAFFIVKSLKELYDHETQRKLINGVIPEDVVKQITKQEKVMNDRKRAIEIEKRVRERYSRKEVEHGSK
ncbi:hypothetical protein [Vagococcus fluvialis]|uniref:hypothetical protein n=1 Tax=Vagococcus fluvialis TaxID=2738 RepID=UPI003D13307A